MSESELQSAIIEALRAAGYWPMRVNAGGYRAGVRLAPSGTPDLLVIDAGGWLEVKAPGGRLSPLQRRWHAKAERKGVRVAVVDSVSGALIAARKWKQQEETMAHDTLGDIASLSANDRCDIHLTSAEAARGRMYTARATAHDGTGSIATAGDSVEEALVLLLAAVEHYRRPDGCIEWARRTQMAVDK